MMISALYRIFILCNASSLKQQSAGRYVSPLGYSILILSQPVFVFALNAVCLAKEQQKTIFI